MEPQIAPLHAILALNTDLLLNCLEGLSEEDALRQLDGGGNTIAFLAAHLTDSRHFLVGRLGHPLANPLSRYLAEASSIEDIVEWPTLAELREWWLDVSRHLGDVLTRRTAEQLTRPNVHRFPLGDSSELGLIAFLVWWHFMQIRMENDADREAAEELRNGDNLAKALEAEHTMERM